MNRFYNKALSLVVTIIFIGQFVLPVWADDAPNLVNISTNVTVEGYIAFQKIKVTLHDGNGSVVGSDTTNGLDEMVYFYGLDADKSYYFTVKSTSSYYAYTGNKFNPSETVPSIDLAGKEHVSGNKSESMTPTVEISATSTPENPLVDIVSYAYVGDFCFPATVGSRPFVELWDESGAVVGKSKIYDDYGQFRFYRVDATKQYRFVVPKVHRNSVVHDGQLFDPNVSVPNIVFDTYDDDGRILPRVFELINYPVNPQLGITATQHNGLTKEKAIKALRTAASQNIYNIRFENEDLISADVISAMHKEAGNTSYTVVNDILDTSGKQVSARISIPLNSLSGDVRLSASVQSAGNAIADKLMRYYSNNLMVVSLTQTHNFPDNAKVKIKLNSNMDSNYLKIYYYDKAENKCTLLKDKEITVDSNRYASFTVSQGGIYIVSEGKLLKR